MTDEQMQAVRDIIKKFTTESLEDAREAIDEYHGKDDSKIYFDLHAKIAMKILDIRWDLFMIEAKDSVNKKVMQKLGLNALIDL